MKAKQVHCLYFTPDRYLFQSYHVVPVLDFVFHSVQAQEVGVLGEGEWLGLRYTGSASDDNRGGV